MLTASYGANWYGDQLLMEFHDLKKTHTHKNTETKTLKNGNSAKPHKWGISDKGAGSYLRQLFIPWLVNFYSHSICQRWG